MGELTFRTPEAKAAYESLGPERQAEIKAALHMPTPTELLEKHQPGPLPAHELGAFYAGYAERLKQRSY